MLNNLNTVILQTLDIIYSRGLEGTWRGEWNWKARPRLKNLQLEEDGNLMSEVDNSLYIKDYCASGLSCKYFIFKNKKTNEKSLFIIFCYGSDITTAELDVLWKKTENIIIKQLNNAMKHDYKNIVIGGHSVGAAMTYYFTVKLWNLKIVGPNKYPASKLYIIMFGLGRLPTRIVRDFENIYKQYKFNIIDIITYDNIKNYSDSFLDIITLHDTQCEFKNPDADMLTEENKDMMMLDPYYCIHLPPSRIKSTSSPEQAKKYYQYVWNQVKKKYELLLKKKTNSGLNEEEENELKYLKKVPWADNNIETCSNFSQWKKPYEKLYNECEKIADIFHAHNTIETYALLPNGNLQKIDKNNFMRKKRMPIDYFISPKLGNGFGTSIAWQLHHIKTYSQYFKEKEQTEKTEKEQTEKTEQRTKIYQQKLMKSQQMSVTQSKKRKNIANYHLNLASEHARKARFKRFHRKRPSKLLNIGGGSIISRRKKTKRKYKRRKKKKKRYYTKRKRRSTYKRKI